MPTDLKGWFTVRAASASGAPTEILIYDQIGKDWFGGDGVSAKEFAQALIEIDAKQEIVVAINSPGGNVWDGLAIYNQLKQRKQYVTVRVDGVAASIASIIALAGKSLEMPVNSLLMIHDPSGLVMGDASAMRDMADRLEQHGDLLAGIYAEKTGKSREKMRSLMRDETWFDGTQAVAMGLADQTTEEIKIAANFNFSAFRYVPAALNKSPNPPPTAAGQTQDIMQKDKILALLKQHGKAIAADATDEIILGAFNELITNGKVPKEVGEELKTAVPDVIVSKAELEALRAQVTREREQRIRNEFAVVAIDRPYLKADEWIPRLMVDESLFATIRAMPLMGADPVRRTTVENYGNSLIEDYRKMVPGEDRMKFSVKNWNGLREAHEQARIQNMSSLSVQEQLRQLHSPRAANTYSATLVTDRLADSFITTIGTRLAALRGFSREFGTDRMKPRATVQVRKVTAGSTTLTNATNFEQGGSTTTPVSVSVAQITQPFNVTNDELNKGHRVEQVAEKNAQSFANAISDVWTALLLVANYGATTQIGAAASFDALDLAPIFALAKNYGQKNLILDGGHLAFLLPTDKFKFRLGEEGAYNFDLIAEHNRWTGAVANTVGLICDPNAIAVCSGLPIDLPSQEFLELNTVTVESLGLTVQLCHWFSRAGREHWMSYDVMFGAAAGDTTAAEVLVTA